MDSRLPPLTDTHCHLDFDKFDPDREDVLARARTTGLTRLLVPSIDLASGAAATHLADAAPEIFAAAGLHPNSATLWDEETLPALRRLAAHPKVVAIGEIGLDYYWDRAPRRLQQQVFRAQLALAAELALPVIVHTRDSVDDVVAILLEWQQSLRGQGSPLADRPGVVHSFSGNETHARALLAHQFSIGITGPVTFKNAPDLQKLVSTLPLDCLLIETDAPFLAPHPHRGQRNEPAYVRWVAEKIAALHGLPFSTVASATTTNAEKLFHWGVAD